MTVDLTINIMTLLAVLTLVWKASALVSEQKSIRDDLTQHTQAEEKHFEDFRQKFHSQSSEIQSIKLEQAVMKARLEPQGSKR